MSETKYESQGGSPGSRYDEGTNEEERKGKERGWLRREGNSMGKHEQDVGT